MEIGEGATCADLLTALHIPSNIPKVILINGLVKDEKVLLQEGDEVSILPPIEGG
jgi:sulfur carrier protein ThiS